MGTKSVPVYTMPKMKNYLESKDIKDGKTQIYLLNRCSAAYAYASGII
mgnify:CR=1 FL=1